MTGPEKAVTFVPAYLLRWVIDGTTERRFPAIVAFADVSGFTAMSEQLASIGKEGAETLTGILNRYFTAMISRIHSGGGFVGKFGGDAMTIFFPVEVDEAVSSTCRRALATCWNLQDAMADFDRIETKGGIFTLGMKIGIASGDVLYRLVESQGGSRDCLLAGLPLDSAAEAEHHGKSGEVILSPDAAMLDSYPGELLEGGFLRSKPLGDLIERQRKPASLPDNAPDHARAFVDAAIYRRLLLGLDSVGEIRRVSVVFLSVQGLDYESASNAGEQLQELYSWVHGVVRKYGGSINKVDMGDKGSKVLITFGAPEAHENDEEMALRCGLELVAENDIVKSLGVSPRVGVATGVVFSGEVGSVVRQEYTVMGRAVNLAARLMGHSRVGELWVDEATVKRAGEPFELEGPIDVQFKGIQQPLPVYRALGLRSAAKPQAASDSPMIGRDMQRRQIARIVDSVASGETGVLVMHGDAGSGKSRLLRQCITTLHERGFLIGAGEALSYAKQSPYLVWISILRGMMAIPPGSGEAALNRLDTVVREIDPEHSFRLPIIASLLGIACPDNEITTHFDALLRQENLFDFVVQYFRYSTTGSDTRSGIPAAILIEDAQWIDRNSLELAAYLLRNIAGAPILLIIARRAYSREFTSPYIKEIEGHEAAVSIHVPDFTFDESREFLLMQLGATSIDEDLMRFIFDAAHGNAAFLLELNRNLMASGTLALVPSDDGIRAARTGDLDQIEVPDSLNGLIMSQIDRLKPEAQLTLKVAAVVGRQFTREIVQGSYPVDTDEQRLQDTIEELQSLDMLLAEFDSDILNYVFKNILTREVAYDSMLFAHRREYHRRVGLCLERLYPDGITERVEELARHFYQSDDDDRASRYLGMAGDKAFDLYANESAELHYSRAIERSPVERDARGRYRLLTMRAKVAAVLGKLHLMKRDLDESLTVADLTGDLKGKVNTLDNLAQYYMKTSDLASMEQVAQEALTLLEGLNHPFGRITVLSKFGILNFLKNDYRTALGYFEQGSQEADRLGDAKGRSMALTNCGLAHKALGDIDKALDCYEASIELDRASGNLKSEAVNLGNLAVLHHQRGDFGRALECYSEALETARKIGSKEMIARNMGNLAVLYQSRGESERAFALFKEKLAVEEMMGYKRGQLFSLGHIGEFYSLQGEYDTALTHFERALQLASETGMRAEMAWIMTCQGVAKQHQGHLERAEQALRDACVIALEVGHKVNADYAHRHLGFLLVESDRLEEAATLFSDLLETSTAGKGKVGMVNARIGLGWIELKQSGASATLEGALEDACQIGDSEAVIRSSLILARDILNRGKDESRAKVLLDEAGKIAAATGRKRDQLHIEALMKQTQDSFA
ncbi:MAG: tetratricopeptide repeat protein [Calditrichaeota bacterium]|nr:tetratricopeptide repeat protein [Calditrichota bacterium]